MKSPIVSVLFAVILYSTTSPAAPVQNRCVVTAGPGAWNITAQLNACKVSVGHGGTIELPASDVEIDPGPDGYLLCSPNKVLTIDGNGARINPPASFVGAPGKPFLRVDNVAPCSVRNLRVTANSQFSFGLVVTGQHRLEDVEVKNSLYANFLFNGTQSALLERLKSFHEPSHHYPLVVPTETAPRNGMVFMHCNATTVVGSYCAGHDGDCIQIRGPWSNLGWPFEPPVYYGHIGDGYPSFYGLVIESQTDLPQTTGVRCSGASRVAFNDLIYEGMGDGIRAENRCDNLRIRGGSFMGASTVAEPVGIGRRWLSVWRSSSVTTEDVRVAHYATNKWSIALVDTRGESHPWGSRVIKVRGELMNGYTRHLETEWTDGVTNWFSTYTDWGLEALLQPPHYLYVTTGWNRVWSQIVPGHGWIRDSSHENWRNF